MFNTASAALRLCITILLILAAVSGHGKERVYFIAADEVDWDYAPSNRDLMMGMAFEDEQNVFVANGEHRIGKVYQKAVFHEYTDAGFRQLKSRPAEWKHLGILGPVLHAEVGDTIKVVFKNNASRPYSVHPHGVFYNKDSEGAMYNDGTSGKDKADDIVKPGAVYTYTWPVPKRAGPGPNDPSSIVWMYHSHVKSVKDTNAGLIGPIIVTAKGRARKDGSPKDVDREFVTLFNVFDENASWYLEANIARTGDPKGVDPDDEGFVESNLMHAMNGYVYSNLPGLEMRECERTRWYLIAMGTEIDLHTPHWHGHTVLHNGNRVDVIELLPASLKVVDMQPDNPGIWMYHCHVNDHITAGMMALYTVLDDPERDCR